MKKAIIKRKSIKAYLVYWLIGKMYVPDRKEIARYIADGLATEHRKALIETLLPEKTHLHRNPVRKEQEEKGRDAA